MNISIICPLYKAEPYIRNLHESLRGQINVDIKAIKYILTESGDSSEDILKELDAEYKKIPREQFSHSKVREEAACEADGDIVVFITQDVIIRDNRWLEKLVAPIVGGEAEACFSRQLCE
ncbi:MAG: glycosyltransferase, partial [Bacillota bacterium]|nr:glycosyltransferase [Bacillota bacterium]